MIKLFWTPKTRSSRALWMLNETGVEFERVHIDLASAASRAQIEFRAASPLGKVPALKDGAVHVADSAAICLYLADRYPACNLAPAIDDPDRGEYLYWMLFTPSVVEPAMSERAGGWEPVELGECSTMACVLLEGPQVGTRLRAIGHDET